MILFIEEMLVLADSGAAAAEMMYPFETVLQSAAILLIGISIIVANVLVLVTLSMATEKRDPIVYYLLSLTVTDLLCGVLVVPLSVYPALVQEWVYGDLLCRLEGYLEVTLWTVTVYTFMWIGVDRYLAIRKPLRYETIQTRTRCQCWVFFSWVTSALLCCPPLLGFSKPAFYSQAYVCVLDWSLMVPYCVTLAFLVLGPSLITTGYTYAYILRTVRKARRRAQLTLSDKEYTTAAHTENLSNPYHSMSFILVLLFWLSWLPLIGLHLYEALLAPVESPVLHFCATWFGVLNSFWKTVVYIFMSPQFRSSLRTLCAMMCCKFKGQPEMGCRH